MSRSVDLKFKLTEWGEDGDTRIREIYYESFGGFRREMWANIRIHGRQLTEREAKLIGDLGAALGELLDQPPPEPMSPTTP